MRSSTATLKDNPGLAPIELVRLAANNEIIATEQGDDYCMYRLTKENNGITQVRLMVETPNGVVARLLLRNGRELTPEERAEDFRRLETLAANPAEQQKKLREQEAEQVRYLKLVRALPNALIYEYDGAETVRGRENIRLRFHTNPKFNDNSRETLVYRATEGKIWIDAAERRITRLEATLVKDVNIGWGLLGHIDRGGHFELQQNKISGGKWRVTALNIEATGKALLFKSIRIHQRQSGSDFRPVSSTLTIAEAVELLKHPETVVADKRAASGH